MFEVNIDQMLTISKYFQTIASVDSHRDNRVIVYARKTQHD